MGGLNGTGAVSEDQIVSDGTDNVTLTLVNETLEGAGTVGDTHLSLDVSSGGVINGDISVLAANTAPLVLTTGSHTIMNAGTLEATNGGTLEVMSAVDNTGTILSSGEGNLVLSAPVTGSGAVDIGANSILDIQAGSVSGNVSFTGGGAQLFMLPGDVGGDITGMAASDTIFLGGFFAAAGRGLHAVWQQTSSTGGTLSLYKNGVDLANVNLAGQFNSLDFVLGTFGRTDETIKVQNTPVYAENPGNNDEWILSDGNWVESAGPGSHPSGYNVALTGDWTGSGTTASCGSIRRPAMPTSGSYRTRSGPPASISGHTPPTAPTAPAFRSSGPMTPRTSSSNGIDDVLWTSTNSDGTIATDIWELSFQRQMDGQRQPRHAPGRLHGRRHRRLDRQRHRRHSVVQRDQPATPTNGNLSNGQWAGSVDLGAHPANSNGNGFQIAGIGDFFDNGRDDVLWTSVNSNGTIATDIWELEFHRPVDGEREPRQPSGRLSRWSASAISPAPARATSSGTTPRPATPTSG